MASTRKSTRARRTHKKDKLAKNRAKKTRKAIRKIRSTGGIVL